MLKKFKVSSYTWFSSDIAILFYLGLCKLLLHFFTNHQYGYFQDELYYIAAGEHLEWGFAEGSPLTPAIANLSRWLMGDSLFSIRFFPAISGAGTVILAGLFARELGGGRLAQFMTAISIILAPGYLFLQTILTMNAFEPLLWTACAYLVVKIIKTEYYALWIVIGLIAGIGLLNKFSISFFLISLVVGLLFTPARKILFNHFFLIGAIIAVVMFLPTIFWQINHHFPFLEHQRESSLYEKKGVLLSAIDLILQQNVLTNPTTVPIWISGIYYYLFITPGKKYQFLGWCYFILLGWFFFFEARYYYSLPIYPMLIAAGAVFWEPKLQLFPIWKYITLGAIFFSGLLFMPTMLPILPMNILIPYSNAIYRPAALTKNEQLYPDLPPWHFQGMLGWQESVAEIAQIYQKLSPQDRQICAILAWNYGNAGAVDLFGPAFNLPKSISGHTGYFFWGPRNYSGDVVLSIGGDLNFLKQTFDNVEPVGGNDAFPIYLCKKIKRPLAETWPAFKFYFKLPNSNPITSHS